MNNSDAAMIRGLVLGVAEMLRHCYDQRSAFFVLRDAGITHKLAREANTSRTDLSIIEKRTWCRLAQNARARAVRQESASAMTSTGSEAHRLTPSSLPES